MTTVRKIDRALIAKLRAAGLEVIEIEGAADRGRDPEHGSFGAGANLNHHTGGDADGFDYAHWLATVGRSDLGPPLCQFSGDRAGKLYWCASGRANHAGKAKASGPNPAGDGNTLYIGWEWQNTGTEGWSKAQYETMVTANAITNLHYGWTAVSVRAHKETSVTGKWDPGALDMTRFREDIAHAMARTKAPKMNEVQLAKIDLAVALTRLRSAITHLRAARTPDGRPRVVVARGAIGIRGAYGVISLWYNKLLPDK